MVEAKKNSGIKFDSGNKAPKESVSLLRRLGTDIEIEYHHNIHHYPDLEIELSSGRRVKTPNLSVLGLDDNTFHSRRKIIPAGLRGEASKSTDYPRPWEKDWKK